MGKVKVCLDLGCTEYILLDTGTVVVQPKDKCDTKLVPKDFQKQFTDLAKEVKETVYVSRQAFKVKVGDEVPIE